MNLEIELDKYLNIKTSGRDATNANYMNFPYEATPYEVLERLANSGYITKKDTIIDYGCGKGRVSFYLAFYCKCKMIGIEYDLRLYNKALENKMSAVSKNRVNIINSCASEFNIENECNKAYFFNPFSVEILKLVINKIKEAKLKYNKEFTLFFYYPSKEYINLLENDNEIKFVEKINCMDLFKYEDEKEKILIYRI